MSNLIARVHVVDDKGAAHVFGPGDGVPPWAVALIPNPKCWDEAPPAATSASQLANPKPPAKRAAARRKAASSDDAVHSG